MMELHHLIPTFFFFLVFEVFKLQKGGKSPFQKCSIWPLGSKLIHLLCVNQNRPIHW